MGKKAAAKVLEMPSVHDSGVAAARQALQDAAEKRRQNSNMHYYLQSLGKKDAYERMSAAEKKEFFLKWFAKMVGEDTTTRSATKKVAIVSEKGDDYVWLSKDAMIMKIGEKKALNKIASGVLEHRPDPDTKNDDEWNREYKLYIGTGRVLERGENEHSLDTTGEVCGDSLTEAMEDMSAAMAHIASERGVCTVAVKKELGEDDDKAKKRFKQGDVESKTFEALKKNARAVLRNCGDTIVTIKTMFEATQEMKYAEALHGDISKLLPKFRTHYNNMEKLVTTGTEDDAMLLAIGKKLDADYEKFNEYAEWYHKLCGGKVAKRQRKI